MTSIKFIGYKYLDYVSKKSGSQIKGYSAFFTEEGSNGVAGLSCFDAFISCEVYDRFLKNIALGSTVNILYDRYGKIVGVNIIK